MGGAEALQKKILSFAHTEFDGVVNNRVQIEQTILSGKGFFGWGDRYMPEPVENGFPEFIVTNTKRFSNLILQSDIRSWRRTAWKRLWFRVAKESHDQAIGLAIKITPKFLHPLLRRIRKILCL